MGQGTLHHIHECTTLRFCTYRGHQTGHRASGKCLSGERSPIGKPSKWNVIPGIYEQVLQTSFASIRDLALMLNRNTTWIIVTHIKLWLSYQLVEYISGYCISDFQICLTGWHQILLKPQLKKRKLSCWPLWNAIIDDMCGVIWHYQITVEWYKSMPHNLCIIPLQYNSSDWDVCVIIGKSQCLSLIFLHL